MACILCRSVFSLILRGHLRRLLFFFQNINKKSSGQLLKRTSRDFVHVPRPTIHSKSRNINVMKAVKDGDYNSIHFLPPQCIKYIMKVWFHLISDRRSAGFKHRKSVFLYGKIDFQGQTLHTRERKTLHSGLYFSILYMTFKWYNTSRLEVAVLCPSNLLFLPISPCR